ncbi:hypothetical protein GGP41_009492 [Bipolaris sorokiniana]|uniref:Uncharacterized protein n=1 Tax=Cochliobolus sativus TaxID=45130 RepID=A0A8H5ZBS7_COCSA|nr:hypothetical protein GGP41_009492 [Bipolaris sorokiniana]
MTPASWRRRVLDGTKESLHRLEIRSAFVTVAGEEFVKEGCGSVEDYCQGTEKEVWVLIVVSVTTVFGKSIAIEFSARNFIGNLLHLCKQRTVKTVVVANCKKVVVARK